MFSLPLEYHISEELFPSLGKAIDFTHFSPTEILTKDEQLRNTSLYVVAFVVLNELKSKDKSLEHLPNISVYDVTFVVSNELKSKDTSPEQP